jgi:RNA 3'-terminal phosphate cyclase (ATP)
MIEIDGSFGEGGGQILRSALALALLTQQPFRLVNIRANRKPKPGLRPQHLASVLAAQQISNAKVSGASLGSSTLVFEPDVVNPGHYHFEVGTAGATALVLHTIYLPLMLGTDAPSEIMIDGGTHVDHAPCFDFLQTTWQAYLETLGFTLKLRLKRPGFYPRGGGRIMANLQPTRHIQPLQLTADVHYTKVDITSISADLPDHVAERQARQAVQRLPDWQVRHMIERWENGPASVVTATLPEMVPTLFFGLGARGKPAEAVADEATEPLLRHAATNAPVDPHSADQLLLPLCFAAGASAYRTSAITQHLLTNAAIIQRFIQRSITIDGAEGATGIVRVGEAQV